MHAGVAPGGLGANIGAAELKGLAGKDTRELIAQALVLTVQVSDDLAVNADVARRHVCARANVPAQLHHERLHCSQLWSRVCGQGSLLMRCRNEVDSHGAESKGVTQDAMQRVPTWQNRIISRSDLPLGSKSEPPLPPALMIV